MTDREPQIAEPVLEDTLHPDVTAECRAAFALGRPWTHIRVIRDDTEGPPNALRCAGGPGAYHLACDLPVEGVQYSSARGCPLHFCERHALEVVEWERGMYDTPAEEEVEP